MGILAWILLGLIAGAIAKAILPGEQGGGWLATIILGIVGAMVGGFLGSVLFDVDLNKGFFNLSTWISAIGGSLIILLIWGFIRSRTSRV